MEQKLEPFVLSTKEDMSVIFNPLKTTQRIKYTCFNISQNFLILGATSGGLYVFKREPCSFLQLLPNKEGAVTQVCISPDERLFAFATVKGIVCVLERNVGPGARLIQISREHLHAQVTDMIWNSYNNELYIGDNTGNISVINILKFMAKNMFNTPTFNLMELDSRIVQLDWFGSLLLVSTMTRCYLCNTFKEEYRQIGQKLRDGEFGACFMKLGDETVPQRSIEQERRGKFNPLGHDEKMVDYEGSKDVKIFCARPSSRVWEVDVDGTVRNTHEFKKALAVAPTSVDSKPAHHNTQSEVWSMQSFNFIKLHILSKKYLFTYKSNGIYIFNPENADLILWSNDFNDIVECRVLNDVIYLRLSTGKMHAIAFASVEKHLISLYLRKNYDLCADLCLVYQEYLINKISSYPKLHLLIDLGEKVRDNSAVAKISPFLQMLSNYYKERQKFQKLKSGIFLVDNMHSLLNNVEEDSSKLLYKEKPKKRSCSLNSSREKKPLTTIRRSKSCSSLLDDSLLKLSRNHLIFKRKQFVSSSWTENNANGHCSTDDDFFNSEFLLPFASVTHPEAIKAIKHISHSVTGKITSGTKTLKEKWQVLEGKVKHLTHELPQEPFDVQISNSKESQNVGHSIIGDEIKSCGVGQDIVYMKTASKKVPYPMLDTSHISQLCIRLANDSKLDSENSTQLSVELLDNLRLIYEQFITSENLTSQNSGLTLNSFLSAKPFPFKHYFPDCAHIIQETLHESLKTKVLLTWLKQVPLSIPVKHEVTPSYLFSVHTQSSLDLDYLLRNTLIIFTELIDSDTIINCIKTSEVPCYYLSLCTILEMYKSRTLNVPSNRDSSIWLLPSLLNAMYSILRMGHAETGSKMGETIDLKDVFYLILQLQYELEDSGIESSRALKECQIQFLTYIDNVHDSSIIVSALKDTELSRYIFNAFKSLNGDANQACSCGFPLNKRRIFHFQNLGDIICEMYWVEDRKQLTQLAGEVTGIWRNILNRREDEDVSNILPLLIHVGEVNAFEKRLLSFDQNRWEEMLELFVKYRAGICLNCKRENASNLNGMTWTDVGMLMVKSLGAPIAIQTLMRHEIQIPSGELTARFYHSCLLALEMDKHAPGLRCLAVDMLHHFP